MLTLSLAGDITLLLNEPNDIFFGLEDTTKLLLLELASYW